MRYSTYTENSLCHICFPSLYKEKNGSLYRLRYSPFSLSSRSWCSKFSSGHLLSVSISLRVDLAVHVFVLFYLKISLLHLLIWKIGSLDTLKILFHFTVAVVVSNEKSAFIGLYCVAYTVFSPAAFKIFLLLVFSSLWCVWVWISLLSCLGLVGLLGPKSLYLLPNLGSVSH